MSLEAYKKAIEKQKECDKSHYANFSRNSVYKDRTDLYEEVFEETPKKKSKNNFGCLCFTIIFVAVLIIAAIKNPSENESRELIKNKVMEYVNTSIRERMNKDGNITTQIGSFLGMMLASTLYDVTVQVDVSDYVLFSTFSATISFDKESKHLGSGIIIFGKPIPLKTESEIFK